MSIPLTMGQNPIELSLDMNKDIKEFADVLVKEGGVPLSKSGALASELSKLASMHLMLAKIDLEDGFDGPQQRAMSAVERKIEGVAERVPEATGVLFLSDPRDTTVGLKFASGWTNSFTGSCKVPLDANEIKRLDGVPFWDDKELQESSPYLLVSIESTGNAAFKDSGVNNELARLMEDAAAKFRATSVYGELNAPLFDLNGNRVGRVELVSGDALHAPETKVGQAIAVVYPAQREVMCKTLERITESIRNGSYGVSASEGHYNYEAPSLRNDYGIEMPKAFEDGRVYMADGIEAGAYRFVVVDHSFEPGYGQDEGDAWLVNALGEPASGYEDGPDTIREVEFREMRQEEQEALQKVIDRRWTLEDLERHFDSDVPELD